jgi:hypothetical protein
VNLFSIIVVLGLAAPGTGPAAPAPAERAPEAGEAGYWEKAPPGNPVDVALWGALRDSQSATMLQLGRIGQAGFRIRYGRYVESLEEAAGAAPPARAEEARRLRTLIETAAKQANDAVPKKGIRVHPCKYTLLHLDQRMRFPGDPAMAASMPTVRAEARGCVADLAPLAARLGPLAEALESALNEADAFLEREDPSTSPMPASPSHPTPAPAGAAPVGPPQGARS